MARPPVVVLPGNTGMGGSFNKSTAPNLLELLQGLSQIASLYQGTIGAANKDEANQAGIIEMARGLGLNKAEAGQSAPAVQSPTGGMVNQPSMPTIQPVNFNALAGSTSAAKAIQTLFEKKNAPAEYAYGNDSAFNKSNPQDQFPVGEPRSTTSKEFAPQVKTDWLPTEDGRYQLMSTDEVNKTTSPVMRDGKAVYATHKQLMEGRGAKLESVTDPYTSSFGRGLGRQDAEQLGGLKGKADDAINSLEIIREAKGLLSSGIYAGSAANIKLGMNKWLQEAGVNIDGQTAANTEAYSGLMGRAVGKIIKQFGSGTGLSDADREYAEKIAAGKITLTEQSITKLLDINERIARFEIKQYNKSVQRARGIKQSGDYLQTIEEPGNKTNSNDMEQFWK